jgi:hypothetical protein
MQPAGYLASTRSSGQHGCPFNAAPGTRQTSFGPHGSSASQAQECQKYDPLAVGRNIIVRTPPEKRRTAGGWLKRRVLALAANSGLVVKDTAINVAFRLHRISDAPRLEIGEPKI